MQAAQQRPQACRFDRFRQVVGASGDLATGWVDDDARMLLKERAELFANNTVVVGKNNRDPVTPGEKPSGGFRGFNKLDVITPVCGLRGKVPGVFLLGADQQQAGYGIVGRRLGIGLGDRCRQQQGKGRAGTWPGAQGQWNIQQAGNAVGNRQSQSEAGVRLSCRIVELKKFLIDGFLILGRDSRTVVADLDARASSGRAAHKPVPYPAG